MNASTSFVLLLSSPQQQLQPTVSRSWQTTHGALLATVASTPSVIAPDLNYNGSGPASHTVVARPIQPPQKLEMKVAIIAYCYILPVVCVLGILGNLMNVITLASRRLRAVSYMYLRALAIADLFCMLFVLVFVSGEILNQLGTGINRYKWYGFYQAHIMLTFINWALATGVFVVVALSVERYVSVVFPMHFRAWNSPRRALKAIIIAYSLPALFYIPYSLGRYSIGSKVIADGQVIYVAIDSEISKTFGWKIYKWTRETVLRFLPIMVLSVLNFQIMMAFRKRQKMFARLTNREQNHASRDDTLLYILGGIVAMFFVCNIPAAINLLFINEAVKKRVDYQIFRAVANLLEITNHAAQFYIFCVCSTDYRVTFMQKFPFPCFQAYYLNRKKLYSFIRRTPKDSTEHFASMNNNSIAGQLNNHHRSVQNTNSTVSRCATTTQKRSTTATVEAISIGGPENSVVSPSQPAISNATVDGVTIGECHVIGGDGSGGQDTALDIHLASGEEDISDESDVFLQYCCKKDGTNGSSNGTTYL